MKLYAMGLDRAVIKLAIVRLWHAVGTATLARILRDHGL